MSLYRPLFRSDTASLAAMVAANSAAIADLQDDPVGDFFYPSTVSNSNTGAENVAALAADIAAANGKMIIIKPIDWTIAGGNQSSNTGGGTIKGSGTGALDISDETVRLWQLPGGKCTPEAGASASTPVMFYFRSCNVELYDFTIDGLNIPEIAIRCDESGSSNALARFKARGLNIVNIGYLDTTGVLGSYGLLLRGSYVDIDGYICRDLKANPTGAYGLQPGVARSISLFNCPGGRVTNFEFTGGDARELDHIQVLDQSVGGVRCRATFTAGEIRYNNKVRRAVKIQGCLQTRFDGLTVIKGEDFAPVDIGSAYMKVTNVTQAASAVVTVNGNPSSSGLIANGVTVKFASIPGMTELNGLSGTVSGFSGGATSTFTVNIDSSGFTAYSAGQFGECRRMWAITAITNANPGVITFAANHGLNNGQKFRVSSVGGMTQLNGNTYRAGGITAAQATLQILDADTGANIDTSAMGTFTSGGEIELVTEIGSDNLTAFDWASSLEGECILINSYIDGSGFLNAVGKTFGPLGKLIADNVDIIGATQKVYRFNNENQVNDFTTNQGWITSTTDKGSGIRNSRIYNCGKALVPDGDDNFCTGNTLYDPVELWLHAGTSTAKDNLKVTDNDVKTITPGYMANGRCGRVDNCTNIEVSNNRLSEAGNTTHAADFIAALNAGATGFAFNNRVPAGGTGFDAGASSVAVSTA